MGGWHRGPWCVVMDGVAVGSDGIVSARLLQRVESAVFRVSSCACAPAVPAAAPHGLVQAMSRGWGGAVLYRLLVVVRAPWRWLLGCGSHRVDAFPARAAATSSSPEDYTPPNATARYRRTVRLRSERRQPAAAERSHRPRLCCHKRIITPPDGPMPSKHCVKTM